MNLVADVAMVVDLQEIANNELAAVAAAAVVVVYTTLPHPPTPLWLIGLV